MKNSTNNSTPDPEAKCFAHIHMTAAEYGFWDVARSFAFTNGVLIFDGRKFAQRFEGMSKDTAYRLAKSLTEKGWFIVKEESVKGSNGQQTPCRYIVVDHDKWTATHPDMCGKGPIPRPKSKRIPPPVSTTRPAKLPVSKNALAGLKKVIHRSQNSDTPVSPMRHNLISTIPIKDNSISNPIGSDSSTGLMHETGEPPSNLQTVKSASGPVLRGGPVSTTRPADVPSTPPPPSSNGIGLKWSASRGEYLDRDGGRVPDALGMIRDKIGLQPSAAGFTDTRTGETLSWEEGQRRISGNNDWRAA